MSNIHAINIIPCQTTINSIASYRAEFDSESFDYNKLLHQLQSDIREQGFMKTHDNTEWMQQRGNDYLSNPKLFGNAPLTYLCVFLGELFNCYEVEELQNKLTPQILKCALTRLQQFK